MVQLSDVYAGEETDVRTRGLCNDMYREWLFDLNSQEKEVWLWNALVEMAKIRQRRGL